MIQNNLLKIIAFYFPQLHAIRENDEWWGKGFTDWDNVRKAKPLFRGHNQPRVPASYNYYDQSLLQTIRWQTELAANFGVWGFCHYHYWFDGKQMLETPTNLLLQTKNINMPFCLAWANETWSRRWDGQDHYILQQQTHDPDIEKWRHHFTYLIKAWSDERAIRISGKPLFIIYRPAKIIDTAGMFDFWQQEARKHGIDGLYFATMKQYDMPDDDCIKNYDAVIQFQPFEAMKIIAHNSARATVIKKFLQRFGAALPRAIENSIYKASKEWGRPTMVDYDEVWSRIVERPKENAITTYPGAFVDWDNTARYGHQATIFKGATPERFECWLSKLLQRVAADTTQEPLVFLNAWNEWSEGAYLEPDEKYGSGYLNAVKSAITNCNILPAQHVIR